MPRVRRFSLTCARLPANASRLPTESAPHAIDARQRRVSRHRDEPGRCLHVVCTRSKSLQKQIFFRKSFGFHNRGSNRVRRRAFMTITAPDPAIRRSAPMSASVRRSASGQPRAGIRVRRR